MSKLATPGRRSLTDGQKVKVLLRYALCPRCGEPFTDAAAIDWDHTGQLAFTNDNGLDNFRPLHRECHKRKTAEDAAARAKAARNAKDVEAARSRILARSEGKPKPHSKWPTRPFPKRRKEARRT